MVYSLTELTREQQASAGGKGGTLARLAQTGYPVPDGFVILPESFSGDELTETAWTLARAQLAALRSDNGRTAFAVRSSALSEDSAQASFAGEFETVLDVKTDADIRHAIQTVRGSRHAERVKAYSAAHEIEVDHKIAVVVQKLVRADFSGVLFTADPLTGSRTAMVGNYVHGSGEKLVSGESNPLTFTLKRPNGKYDGPPELRRYGRALYQLASRLEHDLDWPQDIEWAIADGKIHLLQSRPVTSLHNHNPVTGEWNDSLTGDYLWSNGNFGEAMPGVMTPFTWSVMQAYFQSNALGIESEQFPMGGNIAGRWYVNLSLLISITDAIGLPRKLMLRAADEMFGRLPPGGRIPIVPFSTRWVLGSLIPQAFRRMREVKALKQRVPAFIAEAPALAKSLNAVIGAVRTPDGLLALWHSQLKAHLTETCRMLAAGTSDYKRLSREIHMELEKRVGEADANALMSGVSTGADHLASLGPVLGLTRLARGEIGRADYVRRYGHRGPNELELSEPRPVEDPGWIDRQLAEIARNPVDVESLLAKQRAQHQAAWERFKLRHPRHAKAMRQKLDDMARASKTREAARSEVVRMLGVFRAFARQAGELAGIGNEIFFLSLEEIVALLNGDNTAMGLIPARRETHARYCSLPPYPAIIVGRFDPFQWAADPNRRSDVFDSQATPSKAHNTARTVTGFAGASGVVEGPVRILRSLDEADQFQTGEILVTVTTNIGWTPLFPRAAAIITDVGAPLSHAAIVARELGIPAVVGCGNATMCLKTGDHVRVNGGLGTVEIL